MNCLSRSYLALTAVMIFFAADVPASAAPKAACQVLPASQAQRILGGPVRANGMKTTGNVPGTTGTICDYFGQAGASRLMVITAASPAAAASAMQKMSAQGYPAWAMAQKGASFLIAGGGDPPNRKAIKQMLAVGLRNL